MLLQLSIRNIAVIESAEIAFGSGLNILTGETGAGKSIIIDSVNLILGERADRTLIRSGAQNAYVEALFDISDSPKVRKTLYEMYEDNDSELIISRELSAEGRNACRINGRMATLTQLSQLTKGLIDIHGQHEHQSLLNPNNHIKVLDAFCAKELKEYIADYKKDLKEYNLISSRIDSLKTDDLEKQRRLDMLNFQFNEINNMNLEIGQEERLRSDRDELLYSEKIKESVETSYKAFSGRGEIERGILVNLATAKKSLVNIADINEQYQDLLERMDSLIIESEDIAQELQNMNLSSTHSEGDLDTIESRISDINKLKRKYGSTVEEIIEYKDSIKNQIEDLEENEFIIDDLLKKKEVLYKSLGSKATQITKVRKEKGIDLSENIVSQLANLGMERAKFAVEIKQRYDEHGKMIFLSNGADYVELVISTNPGEELKPLNKIASGGEISRIMLALKTISSAIDEIPTVIFDEIDTGISGNMASVVAQKLATIAIDHQVICVTHTAQIAAMADVHNFIEKQMDDIKAKTDVKLLDERERYTEISRLVGGNSISQYSDIHAKEIVSWSNEYKNSIRN